MESFLGNGAARWARAGAVVVTIGLLSGCAVGTGGADDGGAEYDAQSDLSGELQVMGISISDDVAEARYEHTTQGLGDEVEVDLIEGDLNIQQLLSAVAAGDPPDVIYVNRDQVGSLAGRGALVPLESCIDGEQIDMEQYRESAIEQVTLDGAVYGIPEFNQVQLAMANADLLGAEGLEISDVDGSDWEALTAADAALARDGAGVEVIGVDPKLPDFFPLWAKANGADLISADGREANLDDPAVVEALEFTTALYEAHGGFGAIKAKRDAADFFGEGNQFAAGELGAMPMEQWYLNVLNDVTPDAPMAFATMKTREGDPIAFTGGSAWAIPAGGENAAAACRWAKLMTGVDAWMAAADARAQTRADEGKPFTGLITGNEIADEQIRAMTEDAGDVWSDGIRAAYEANEASFSLPANPADNEFKQIYLDAVNRVLDGRSTPQESLEQGQSEAQAALDEAWEVVEENR